ncbi:MAG: nicotinate (nicotinamide) nucleotide adenylyltransferase [archaeon]|nr:nicotinate (nicotinamide) nucleotide adenylyltransferase [archaeon]
MKIGLFGGSFNPVHNVHIFIAKSLIDKKLVDEVWFVPCKEHSFEKSLESFSHRANMINFALDGLKNLKICEVEKSAKGKSYTIDTLRKLRAIYNHEFFIVVGADILGEINRWYCFDDLKREAKFIVFKRAGYQINNPGINMKEIDVRELNISSSMIRKLVAERISIKEFVPAGVEDYIHKNKLFIKI